MSEISLRTVVRAQIVLRAARRALAASPRHAADRLRREQTGQDVLEYAGMIVLVAAVIALLFQLNIPNDVVTAVQRAINSVFSKGSSTYSAPTLTNPSSG